MGWIKRNLYFVIGAVVSLALMGLAGWFLYSKWSLNNDNLGQLNAAYDELRNLNNQNPHPGKPPGTDNIKLAKEQQQQLRDYIQKTRRYYQPIAPIPSEAKMTDQIFSSAISRTISQLQHAATNASVGLRADNNGTGYNFSFEAQKQLVSFSPGSLGALAVQLGEVKALCDILFQAKINALDNIRRERVSADDSGARALQTDYHNDKSVSNDLAVLTPYELKFRCFSAELAAVLSGLAGSPNNWVVKTINVEPAPATETTTPNPVPMYGPQTVMPAPNPAAEEAFRSRYGIGSAPGRYGADGGDRYGTGGGAAGGIPYRPLTPGAPAYAAPPTSTMPTAPPSGAPAAGRGSLQTVLDERPLNITMTVILVKPLPGK
jgi:hypothetical protein